MEYWPVFVDPLLATLVHLCHVTTHDVLVWWFGVDRATITRALGEVRPLPPPERGCTAADGRRLRILPQRTTSRGPGRSQ
ncbi:hypothetical protein [Streptomyces sp. NBC_00233]|uniref:hypothetical protein n=1 Tax=Streptomyces sp. NBC_00233 TaxID=2975686 RepID=UPI00225A9337|nr:hypothetical protein [Streptomyces sp. NBC_00233]MCX5231302.1 transposase family protein [Streptomyces sp. NBC_00233]